MPPKPSYPNPASQNQPNHTMPSKQDLQSQVEDLAKVVVSIYNTLQTTLEYIKDSIDIEDEDEELEEDEDETCCDCGKPVY